MVVLLDKGFEIEEVGGTSLFGVATDETDMVVADEAVVFIAVKDVAAMVVGLQDALSEADGSVGQTKQVEQGGEEVYLLNDTAAHRPLHAGHYFPSGVINHHRDAIPAVIAVVFRAESLSAMVGGDDEEGAVKPGFLAGFVEETT